MKLNKFIPLTKIEETPNGTLKVFGLVTAEQPDLDKEVCDYNKTKPFYVAKVAAMQKATAVEGMEQSIMPMREMHQLVAIGKGVTIEFDDANKAISMGFEVVEPNAITKFKKGVLIGFSQGGDYVKPDGWPTAKIKDPVFKGCVRYVANPGEVSAVDSPCLPIALVESLKARKFSYVKADGTTELRKFAITPPKIEVAGDDLLKIQGELYEVCEEADSEFQFQDKCYKRKLPEVSVADRLDKIEQLLTDGMASKSGITPPDVIGANTPATDPVQTMEANVNKEAKTKRKGGKDLSASDFAFVGDPNDTSTWKLPVHDKAHAANALARFGQTQGIPEDQKKKVWNKIVAAAKKFGIEVTEDANKVCKAFIYLSDPAKFSKCFADISDLADALQTLRIVTNWQTMEAAEDGDASTVPHDLRQVMEDLVAVFQDLVSEEMQHLLATTSGGKEEKAMTAEELQKKASAHLAKAKEMVKAHVEHMGNVMKVHLDSMAALHKAHADGVASAPNLDMAKGMASSHANTMGSVCKTHHDHVTALHKAFGDEMSDHLSKIDSPSAPNIASTAAGSTAGSGPTPGTNAGPQNESMAAPGTKALTLEDLQKALKDQAETMQKQHEEETELLIRAMFGPVDSGDTLPVAKTAPGIGDRTQIVNKVHQTNPVSKAADMTNTTGQPVTVDTAASIITEADVIKMGNGDQDALLKMARSIKKTNVVPQHLQGTRLLQR